ncbi:MAG: NAD(P)H-quinone oxidoreductase [Brevibacterium yomogidense]|uniref:NAD(P)H-quinone oxidoreductase n=1 Tax=Brevibacterium sp. Mu109 TaxID=1255669 RepID=UPI000C3FE007|nr:NAD(P)H-quinone oxidoreductase [Brevibacterium sp. Mu109]SMX65574.1 putative NAD(P)H quinone oxidoreductase, PIG3 family [Brevibacterium sp. Mu109]
MRAITLTEHGGPDVLTVSEIPSPTARPGSVVVDVHTAGLNRADLLQRQGHYNPPAGANTEHEVPGLEVSGTISSIGDGVTDWAVGDRVAALLAEGGYAEQVEVPAGQLLAVPDGFSLAEAAALPEVLCTVHSNVFTAAGLAPGEWLLVHGGGSGIGTAAIQMAKSHGAKVAVTVGSDRKGDFCRDLGADAVINYKEEDFVERIREITGDGDTPGDGADVILDVVGAKYLDRNIKALAVDGRLTIIGLQGGVKAEANLGRMLPRRLTVMATTLRARPEAQKARIVAAVAQTFWQEAMNGGIKPIVDSEFPLADAAQAHARMEAGENIGKILLSVAADG